MSQGIQKIEMQNVCQKIDFTKEIIKISLEQFEIEQLEYLYLDENVCRDSFNDQNERLRKTTKGFRLTTLNISSNFHCPLYEFNQNLLGKTIEAQPSNNQSEDIIKINLEYVEFDQFKSAYLNENVCRNSFNCQNQRFIKTTQGSSLNILNILNNFHCVQQEFNLNLHGQIIESQSTNIQSDSIEEFNINININNNKNPQIPIKLTTYRRNSQIDQNDHLSTNQKTRSNSCICLCSQQQGTQKKIKKQQPNSKKVFIPNSQGN